MTQISRIRGISRFLITAFNAGFVLTFLFGLISFCVFLLARSRGTLVEVEILEFSLLFLVVVIVVSPLMVFFHGAERVTDENGPELIEAVRNMPFLLFPPRIYLVEMEGPNAFAVGWWPISSIGISRDLLELTRSSNSAFSQRHLQAVVLHEVGHHALGHSLLLPPLAVLVWVGNKCTRALRESTGGTRLPLLLMGMIAGWILKFPVAAISQEFEYAADNFAVFFAGNTEDLSDALAILGEQVLLSERSPLQMVLASHPGYRLRLEKIRELQKE